MHGPSGLAASILTSCSRLRAALMTLMVAAPMGSTLQAGTRLLRWTSQQPLFQCPHPALLLPVLPRWV
jgi:hypothetical protein